MLDLTNKQNKAVAEAHRLIANMFEKEGLSTPYTSLFKDEETYKRELGEKAIVNFDRYLERLQNAIKLLAENKFTFLPESGASHLITRLEEQNLHHLEEGRPLQEVLDISDSQMAEMYACAYRFFNEQHYAEAADIFLLLSTLTPMIHSFWLGLGMAEQHRGDFEAAIMAYWMALALDEHNLLPLIHGAECLHLLRRHEEAIALLELILSHPQELVLTHSQDSDGEGVRTAALKLKKNWLAGGDV